MGEASAEEFGALIRIARQRLESLRRAGLDWMPAVALPAAQPQAPRHPRAAQVQAPSQAAPGPAQAPAPIKIPAGPATRPPDFKPVAGSPKLAASLFEEARPAAAVLSPPERVAALEALAAEVAVCQRCPHLAASRTQTVFGVGNSQARLMFIGEAPGADEDRLGEPFVGRSGALLTDMITKGMGLSRDQVYIANILKSRPPENRQPMPDEIAHCLPYLERQIEIVQPEFLCLLGKTAAATLLQTALPMSRLRNKWHRYRAIPTIVTYHPSYLLRTPEAKRDSWDDLKMLMQAMGIKPPARK